MQRIFKRFNSNFCVRTPSQVAQRVLGTQLLLSRSIVEQSDQKIAYETLSQNCSIPIVKEALTKYEQDQFAKEFKSWNSDDVLEAYKRWESFGVLLWALRVFKEIPREPETFPKDRMYQSTGIIPAMPETLTTFLDYFNDKSKGFSHDHFITTPELQNEINVCEAWYWRSRAQVILDFKQAYDAGNIPKDKVTGELQKMMNNIEEAVKLGSQTALEKGFINELVDGDFSVGGVAFQNLGDHEMREVSFRYEKRMAALAWLCGLHDWEYTGDLKFINPMGSLFSPE